jgi:hypothetical protein
MLNSMSNTNMSTILTLAAEQQTTILSTLIGFTLGGAVVYFGTRHPTQHSPESNKHVPAPITIIKGPPITPTLQTDTSPPIQYGANAPGPSMPEYHVLMQEKKELKERDKAVVRSMMRKEGIVRDQEKAVTKWGMFSWWKGERVEYNGEVGREMNMVGSGDEESGSDTMSEGSEVRSQQTSAVFSGLLAEN